MKKTIKNVNTGHVIAGLTILKNVMPQYHM